MVYKLLKLDQKVELIIKHLVATSDSAICFEGGLYILRNNPYFIFSY